MISSDITLLFINSKEIKFSSLFSKFSSILKVYTSLLSSDTDSFTEKMSISIVAPDVFYFVRTIIDSNTLIPNRSFENPRLFLSSKILIDCFSRKSISLTIARE